MCLTTANARQKRERENEREGWKLSDVNWWTVWKYVAEGIHTSRKTKRERIISTL